MCGIVLLQGLNSAKRLPICIEKLKHRGPDESQTWLNNSVALGFTRLSINEEGDLGRQPYTQGDWVAVVNGEIYNHQDLSHEYELNVSSNCDTHIVLPLFLKLGLSVINELDGFYSAILFNHRTKELYLLRDYMGKKPLFIGCSNSEFFITSELKAIDNIDWFESVPKGIARVDITKKQIIELVNHELKKPVNDIVTSLHKAVAKRLPVNTQPFGLFLSGGVDSSIIAAIISKYRKDVICFVLGSKESLDYSMAIKVAKSLGLHDVRTVEIPSGKDLKNHIESVVYTTESFNPSIVSNGLATYLLAQAAKAAGLKVVLTGEGADELFGGYFSYLEPDELQFRRNQLVSDMHFTELRRLDLSTMAHSIEARCPFLDKEIFSLSENLNFEDIYCEGSNKVILRERFREELPKEVIDRPKTSFDVGSGIRGIVVEYLQRNGRNEREELYDIWQHFFHSMPNDKYFDRYPAFDAAIELRGIRHR